MVLRTPVEPGTLTDSDMEAGVSDILLVSRLQWEILERLRLAGSGCQLSEMAKLNHLRGRRSQRPCQMSVTLPPSLLKMGAAGLSFTARIEGAHSDRAASASKKDGLAVPLPPLQARSLSP